MRFFSVLVLFLLGAFVDGGGANMAWQWSLERTSNTTGGLLDLAVNASGDLFGAGYTRGSVGGRANAGGHDAVLVHVLADGTLDWAVQCGSSENDAATRVAVDSAGDLIVVGLTRGALDGNTHAGKSDVFLMRFLADGAWQWTAQRGSSDMDWPMGVAVNAAGHVFIAGASKASLDGNAHAGMGDAFLMSFLPNGTWQWTVQRGSPGDEWVAGMAVNSLGDFLVVGGTTGSLDSISNAGDEDMFLMCFLPDGTWSWTRQRGTSKRDWATAVTVNSADEIFAVGGTRGLLDGNAHAGGDDVFLMRFLADGTWQWTLQRGSAGEEDRAIVAIGPDGGVFVAGSTTGGLDGHDIAMKDDIYVMHFSSTGDWNWTLQRATGSTDRFADLVVSSGGDVVVSWITEPEEYIELAKLSVDETLETPTTPISSANLDCAPPCLFLAILASGLLFF